MVLFDIHHSPPDDVSARVAPSQVCEQSQTANADGAQVPQGKKRCKHIAPVAAGEAFCESCCTISTVDMSCREHAQDPRESADGMPAAPVMNIRNTTGNDDNTVGAATGDDPDAAPEGKDGRMERR
ncbi:hypothetical protein WOLCODRAFT_163443 [Wolfiporia cocos MD-104 SS10]|uniref:Uncharacterized protein n=1 Tax=Wolfiporia cocos (strain MD-104) TaxID=742152 RepID=A0A2H3JIE8_WOLCO|nr:hypothetical protein WOLCODRAFT_163443 [Wolfiporia cocos MD-104 SS10]